MITKHKNFQFFKDHLIFCSNFGQNLKQVLVLNLIKINQTENPSNLPIKI